MKNEQVYGKQFHIVLWHHKHGIDVAPVYDYPDDYMDDKEVINLVFEEELDEQDLGRMQRGQDYIEWRGPWTIPK